jgi:RNA polymerase sigma-70 factor (ECF subfamily)
MDRDLVERAKRGDQVAFAAIARQLADPLLGVARRILRDPGIAEDVVQDTLVTIWRKLPSLREAAAFEGWAYRILVRACYAVAPTVSRWTGTVRDLPLDRADGAGDLRSIGDRDELERAFRRLSVEQRAVVVLHYHLGLSLAEVGAVLGIPPGTARSRLHYATRALRAAFEADAIEPVLQEGRLA